MDVGPVLLVDPVNAACSDTPGGPLQGFGVIRAHKASGNSCFAMAPSSMALLLLPGCLHDGLLAYQVGRGGQP
jgi:hypothetical protein